jgi:hypothetical protein
LIEGHATWIQERVAAELHLDESAQRLATQMGAAAAAAPASRTQRSESANTRGYLEGKRFVEAVFKRGGLPAVQKLFESPPKSPELIANPEYFFSQQKSK